jgi:hypothetical protein
VSAEAVTVVLHHSKTEGTAKLVLWGIANHHSDSGAWPSIATLAKYAQVSERRVQQIIRDLARIGEIAIEEQGGLGQHQYKTNRYHILIQCPADCDGSLNHKTGVKSGAVRGEIQSPSGVKPISPEPNKELNNNLSLVSEQFDEFWKEYPRKEGKKPAFKAFRSALSRATFEDILAGVIAYKQSDRVRRGYIKLPASWLNEDLWEDAATIVQATQVGDERKVKEKQFTDSFLAEMQELEKQAAPAPKCPHGNNIALCRQCLR